MRYYLPFIASPQYPKPSVHSTNTLTQSSLARSVYSREERTLLGWLSHHYETQRKVIWSENSPPTRWIVSFDNDLLDGLVLAALLSSYCPFLVSFTVELSSSIIIILAVNHTDVFCKVNDSGSIRGPAPRNSCSISAAQQFGSLISFLILQNNTNYY